MKELYPDAKPFSDVVPALLEKKYLKTIWWCHKCNGTLDWDKNGEPLDVFDLDFPTGGNK